jgi:dienelactone hydrolase
MLATFADQTPGVEFAAAVNLLQKDAKVDGTLFVPERIRRVRAVIVVANWGVGQSFYSDSEVHRLVEMTDSALLLARFSNVGPSTQQYRNNFSLDGAAALVLLLQRLADESGHRELAAAPLLFWGFSAGGGGIFAEALPRRTIGLVLYHSFLAIKPAGPADWPARSQIPILFVAGEKDLSALAVPMEELWKKGRSVGAPWTFAVEPGAPHFSEEHLKKANGLMLPWIAGVLRQRVSADGDLRTVTDASGWMGRNQTGETAAPGTFSGSRTEVSWLPDEASARGWQVVIGRGQ